MTFFEQREHTEANRRRVHDLATRLAMNAEEIAETLERAAELHDTMSYDPRHPLRDQAAAHAEEERRLAASEREEAVRLRALAALVEASG